jgi:hypothetical protein
VWRGPVGAADGPTGLTGEALRARQPRLDRLPSAGLEVGEVDHDFSRG